MKTKLAETVNEYAAIQDIEAILEASKKSKEILQEITSFIRPGTKESEAYAFANSTYQKHGITRSWHNPYIRFGTNTVLTYADKAKEDIRLEEDDIAFIDLGPIWDDVEGDVGKTIVFGDNRIFLDLKETSETLFQLGLEHFRKNNPTGREMQKFISSKSEELGYQYMLESGGHLIGLFSHGATWNKGISEYDGPMQPGIWILEIHIKHPELPYGAFFEDILI